MPRMDGYEVCRKIRQDRTNGPVKIIMVSTESKPKERLRGYETGVDDYIGKPFDEHELLAKIHVFMRLKNVEDELIDLNNKLNEQIRIRTQQLSNAEKISADWGKRFNMPIYYFTELIGLAMGVPEERNGFPGISLTLSRFCMSWVC